MRSTLARPHRGVPLAFVLIIAVMAGIFTFTTQSESAHAGVLGHVTAWARWGFPPRPRSRSTTRCASFGKTT